MKRPQGPGISNHTKESCVRNMEGKKCGGRCSMFEGSSVFLPFQFVFSLWLLAGSLCTRAISLRIVFFCSHFPSFLSISFPSKTRVFICEFLSKHVTLQTPPNSTEIVKWLLAASKDMRIGPLPQQQESCDACVPQHRLLSRVLTCCAPWWFGFDLFSMSSLQCWHFQDVAVGPIVATTSNHRTVLWSAALSYSARSARFLHNICASSV